LLLEATLLVHSGQLEAAVETASRLHLIDRDNAGAHYVLALCREHAGRPDRASEHHRAAAHFDPAFAMPRLHLVCWRAAPATMKPRAASSHRRCFCSNVKTHPGCCCSEAASAAKR